MAAVAVADEVEVAAGVEVECHDGVSCVKIVPCGDDDVYALNACAFCVESFRAWTRFVQQQSQGW